jgi:hypothetical protein
MRLEMEKWREVWRNTRTLVADLLLELALTVSPNGDEKIALIDFLIGRGLEAINKYDNEHR